jgi:putative chitinase
MTNKSILNKNFFDKVRISLFSGKLTEKQVSSLNDIFEAWLEIDGEDLRLLAYSLATTYHEVGSALTPISENLNYSAKRMTEVWPSRFPTIASAKPYENNPQKLGTFVYGGRLGNNKTGDGYTYRGRGYSQITGKVNYEKFSKLLKIDLVNKPELAMEPKNAAKILILGIRDGIFTGRKFSDYKTYETSRPTVNADSSRKTNNGKSTIAKDIANYANNFEKALNGGISTSTEKNEKKKEDKNERNILFEIITFIINLIRRK